jgi:hypothetical protein
MQYFDVCLKSELLFYLVTKDFAQSLSDFVWRVVWDRVKAARDTRSNTSRSTLGRSHKCRIIST